MKKTISTIITSTVSATALMISVGCFFLVPYMDFGSKQQTNDDNCQKVDECSENLVVINTNSFLVNSSSTNITTKKNKPVQNVDWFIQGSSYIWDGWKLK